MSGQRWEVIGGEDSGGILVRTGQDLRSEKEYERLAKGSLLEELILDEGRLYYRLLSGKGPERGWVSIKLGQKDLVVKTYKLPAPTTAVQAPERRPAVTQSKAPTSKAANSEPAPDDPLNGYKGIQLSEEAQIAIARETVKQVCKLHGLRLFPVEADGNCQFRALAHEILGDQNLHAKMREMIVSFLMRQKKRYSNSEYLEPDQTIEEYCVTMLSGTKDKETGKLKPTWGDFLTLQGACDMEGAPITLLNNHPKAPIKTFYPRTQKTNRPIVMTYILRLHYDATMPDPEAESYYGDENTQVFSKFHRLEELS